MNKRTIRNQLMNVVDLLGLPADEITAVAMTVDAEIEYLLNALTLFASDQSEQVFPPTETGPDPYRAVHDRMDEILRRLDELARQNRQKPAPAIPDPYPARPRPLPYQPPVEPYRRPTEPWNYPYWR